MAERRKNKGGPQDWNNNKITQYAVLCLMKEKFSKEITDHKLKRMQSEWSL